MEYGNITRSVIDFQKKSFDNWYDAMALLQDQTLTTMDAMLNQTPWIPEDGRTGIQKWLEAAQEERKRFKSYVDDSYVAMEKAMRNPSKSAEKPKKAASQS